MAGDPAQGIRFDPKAHWESVYRTRRVDEVSWFRREPSVSFALIRKFAPQTTARIIDVGGGASSLVDTLVTGGLPVVRYSAETLHNELGAAFQLLESVGEQHVTPSGATQTFVYSAFRFAPNT